MQDAERRTQNTEENLGKNPLTTNEGPVILFLRSAFCVLRSAFHSPPFIDMAPSVVIFTLIRR